MSTLYAILGSIVAAAALLLGGLFGGIRYQKTKQAKVDAENERDLALEVSRVDSETMAKHDIVRRMPAGADKLDAAGAAADAAVDSYRRRRRDD